MTPFVAISLCGLRWFCKHKMHIVKTHSGSCSSFASDSSQSALGCWNLLRTPQECDVWRCQSNSGKFRPTTHHVALKLCCLSTYSSDLSPLMFSYEQSFVCICLVPSSRSLQAPGNRHKYSNIHQVFPLIAHLRRRQFTHCLQSKPEENTFLFSVFCLSQTNMWHLDAFREDRKLEMSYRSRLLLWQEYYY